MNKQTGICPGMHALCFLRSVWLWLSLSMTHCHTLLHTSFLRRQTSTSSSPFALTHTQTERHLTDTIAWESVSHHVAFRVFQRLIRCLGCEASGTGVTFRYGSLNVLKKLTYDKLNNEAKENYWVGN